MTAIWLLTGVFIGFMGALFFRGADVKCEDCHIKARMERLAPYKLEPSEVDNIEEMSEGFGRYEGLPKHEPIRKKQPIISKNRK